MGSTDMSMIDEAVNVHLATDSDCKVYQAVCNPVTKDSLLARRALKYPNYSITIGLNDFSDSDDLPEINWQITVYSEYQIKGHTRYQKLFLIKDTRTLGIYKKVCAGDLGSVGKIHFNIDTSFLTKEILKEIVQAKLSAKVEVTLDSCLTGFIVNGECPYKKGYVDINYDSTVRKCPFEPNGIQFETRNLTVASLYHLDIPDTICKYYLLFYKT